MHPAFVGRFALTTSNAAARVHAAEGVEDPSGEGLERQVRTDKVIGGGKVAEGRIWWGGDEDWDEHESWARSVRVASSNGPIDLFLPDV